MSEALPKTAKAKSIRFRTSTRCRLHSAMYDPQAVKDEWYHLRNAIQMTMQASWTVHFKRGDVNMCLIKIRAHLRVDVYLCNSRYVARIM